MIRGARAEDLRAVAAFVAARQADLASRIAYFGESPAEIEAYLPTWSPPWTETSRVAVEGTTLTGYIGAELDVAVGRAWIHGPLVSDASWDAVAEELWTALLPAIPQAIEDVELTGDVANVRLAAFAARRGLTGGDVHVVLELQAAAVDRLPAADVPRVPRTYADELVTLHEELFPNTYYSGRQLLEQAESGEATLLGVVVDEQLVGYAVGRIDEAGAGYIDFLGVAPGARRAGYGRTLVTALCRALRPRMRVPAVRLTVAETSAAALALYDGLGFRRVSSAIGYRRR